MNKELINLSDTARIYRYHKTLIDRYGAGTTRALGWPKIEGQSARFETLSQIGDLSGHSVLDAGCGHADLYPFLKKRFSSLTYHGCEQIPEMLHVATQRYKRETNVVLFQGDFLDSAMPVTDFVLASGSLTYRHSDDKFVYDAIKILFTNCRIALGFNLLSGGVEASTLLRAYAPDDILNFCRTLSTTVQLQVGYWPDDFTIFVYKG
ncbi:class I SAM-dependent methyltransferase [Spirosoma flavum]|uniref:Class I SAM-dependent methyltransferase n=1 Tax=Spirosoma flavum TaxID=2048557 RepID=A0ABW6AIN3_9BACT